MINRIAVVADKVAVTRRVRDRRGSAADTERFTVKFASRAGIEAEISEVLFGDFDAVADLVRVVLSRDVFTRQHLVHTNVLAQRFGFSLGLSGEERTTFLRAGFLHDIGKIAIADDLLMKPAALTATEYQRVQMHAEIGRTILMPYRSYRRVATIVGQHHEHFDGRGYPHGLAGNAIDVLARATSILDAFSAMILDRPYHRGSTDEEALVEIERCSGTQFDPELAREFVSMMRLGHHV